MVTKSLVEQDVAEVVRVGEGMGETAAVQEAKPKVMVPLMSVATGVFAPQPRAAGPVPLDMLAVRIREEVAGVVAGLRSSLEHARAAGDLLLQAKVQMDHGDWGGWLEKTSLVSQRTAEAYMRIAGRWDSIRSKSQRTADLTISHALKLLAKPSTKKARRNLPNAAGTKQEPPKVAPTVTAPAKTQPPQPAETPSASGTATSGSKGTPQVPRVEAVQVEFDLTDLRDSLLVMVEKPTSFRHWDVEDRDLTVRQLTELKALIEKVTALLVQPMAPVTPKAK
jgi:hypothetical protein